MTHVIKLAAKERFDSMAELMGKWVDRVMGTGYRHYRPGEAWVPAINLYEDEKHYCMIADLAGVQVEEIDLRVDEGMLILSGRRDTPGMQQQFGEKRVHLMEIDHGRFCRKVQLPSDVIIDKIQASYRVGYLVVRLPKKEE